MRRGSGSHPGTMALFQADKQGEQGIPFESAPEGSILGKQMIDEFFILDQAILVDGDRIEQIVHFHI